MNYLFNLIIIILALFVLVSCQDENEPGLVPIERQTVLVTPTISPPPILIPTLTVTSTFTETILTAEFLENVALLTIEERVDDPIDGSIISYKANKGGPNPAVVWRYSQGSLQEIDHRSHYQALGNNKANWPPRLFIFHFEKIGQERIVVFVNIHYNSGIIDNSRGGKSERIILRFWEDRWSFLMSENVMFWD